MVFGQNLEIVKNFTLEMVMKQSNKQLRLIQEPIDLDRLLFMSKNIF